MLIVGAKGMAKELLEILSIEMKLADDEIVFFDDLNQNLPDLLYGRFKLLRNFEEVTQYFSNNSNLFTLGLGNPVFRRKMAMKFSEMGGILTTVISTKANVGSFNTYLGTGTQIMQGVIITNDVNLGQGVLINLNSTISHDCSIGNYTEIACNVSIAGRCIVGENVFIGSNATLNPDVRIGDNVIIGSGAVIIDNVPANVTVVGNRAKIIKYHE